MAEHAIPTTHELWRFLVVGYFLTIAVETPILVLALPRVYRLGQKLTAGMWLTACTYPIVVLVLPVLIWQPYGRLAYLAVAESFAPLAECVLFGWVFGRSAPAATWARRVQEWAAIVAANLASFGLGEFLARAGWF